MYLEIATTILRPLPHPLTFTTKSIPSPDPSTFLQPHRYGKETDHRTYNRIFERVCEKLTSDRLSEPVGPIKRSDGVTDHTTLDDKYPWFTRTLVQASLLLLACYLLVACCLLLATCYLLAGHCGEKNTVKGQRSMVGWVHFCELAATVVETSLGGKGRNPDPLSEGIGYCVGNRWSCHLMSSYVLSFLRS